MNLAGVVAIIREQTEEEKLYHALLHHRKLKVWLRKQRDHLAHLAQYKLDQLEADLGKFKDAAGESWLGAWMRTLHREFGDPKTMYEKQQKQHAAPYWNPTTHKINIHPLGIVKGLQPTGECIFEEFVEPGGQVSIPWSLTVGGKHSPLAGVAPQLKPLPCATQHDESDVSPITYNEWCAFVSPARLSDCCGRPLIWDCKLNQTLCQRCQKHASSH